MDGISQRCPLRFAHLLRRGRLHRRLRNHGAGQHIIAPAQADEYPDKPIRVISDSAPGSAVDVTFRMVMPDVIAGRVPLIIEGYSGVAGAIQAHTLNALAVGSRYRLSDFPKLPTAAETLPVLVSSGWQGVVAPLGTPAADIQKVNEALKKTLAEPDLAKQLAGRGAFVDAMTPPEVTAFNAQQAQWKPVLQAFEASINK